MLKKKGLLAEIIFGILSAGFSLENRVMTFSPELQPEKTSENGFYLPSEPSPLEYGRPRVNVGLYADEANGARDRMRGEIYEDEMRCANIGSEDGVSAADITNSDRKKIEELIQSPWEEVAKSINTPREAAAYCLTALTHGGWDIDRERWGKDYWMSGKQTHDYKIVDCDDAAMAAASLLKDNGFPGYLLCIEGYTKIPGIWGMTARKRFGHAMFIYKTPERLIGSIGINKSDVRAPEARSIDEFLQRFSLDAGDEIETFRIYDIGSVYSDYDTNDSNNNPNP